MSLIRATPANLDWLQGWEAGVKIQAGWLPGVYFLAPFLRTAIVVIHQLPAIPETLWLRMLGKGTVQKQAVAELKTLPENGEDRERHVEELLALSEEALADVLELVRSSSKEEVLGRLRG